MVLWQRDFLINLHNLQQPPLWDSSAADTCYGMMRDMRQYDDIFMHVQKRLK